MDYTYMRLTIYYIFNSISHSSHIILSRLAFIFHPRIVAQTYFEAFPSASIYSYPDTADGSRYYAQLTRLLRAIK